MGSYKDIVLALVAISLLVLTGCSGQTPAAPREPLRVEWTLWEGDYTILIAQELGLFEKHGVNVEPVHYDIFYEVIPDLAGGKIDGGLLAMGDLLTVARLTDVKGVMAYDSGGISSIVAAPEITSIADLRGKRIGVNLGSSGEMILRTLLTDAGVNVQDVIFVEMDVEALPDAIPTAVDAGFCWEPYTSQAVRTGNRLLYTSDTESLVPDLLVFRKSVVDDRPEDIRAFIAAWFEALEYRQGHPQEALEIIRRATGLNESDLGITGEDRLYTLDDNLRLFEQTAADDPSSIYFIAQTNVDFLVNAGELTEVPVLTDVLDPSFLK